MFIFDKPICYKEDDFLGRNRFSEQLGNSLLRWKEKESLVIAIYGEWGSGKSSVINLAKEFIVSSEVKDKPTIIEFNPWLFSEQKKLTEHFFNEIAKELEIKDDSGKDKEIAKKLKFYASLLNLTPDSSLFNSLHSKVLIGLGLLGISASQIFQLLSIQSNWIKYTPFILGFIFVLLGIFKDYLLKFAELFENKSEYFKKSAINIKEEIRKILNEREKKLIIIIDDIDRLNQAEIRQIFRLIRANADFPNTIYLLAFERKIIEKNLEEQAGVSGKDYLDKIVQVNFDIPFAKPSKIAAFLFKELDRILAVLPVSANKYFENDPYWTNVYHSGFKNLFKNIRDVKRYISSLEFNISQLYREDIIEVNPIDFIAVEAIRVFAPDFYNFMKSRNLLFTSTERDPLYGDNKARGHEIQENIDKLSDQLRSPILELIKRLFPQVEGVLEHGRSSYGNEWQSTWNKQLRICATQNYDSYFTLTPGGDEEEISQYEINKIIKSTTDEVEFEQLLCQYIENKKIRKVLQRLQDYTDDQKIIPQDRAKSIVQALFNISDELPGERSGTYDFGADMDLARIIYQILKREGNKLRNFDIFKESIRNSKGLFGPIQEVTLHIASKKEGRSPAEQLIPEDKLDELQDIGLCKIIEFKDKILRHRNFPYILFRWKEWNKSDALETFIKETINYDESAVLFLNKFISETQSQSMGDYGTRTKKSADYRSIGTFYDLEKFKERIKSIKEKNADLYELNKESIDLFLRDFPLDVAAT